MSDDRFRILLKIVGRQRVVPRRQRSRSNAMSASPSNATPRVRGDRGSLCSSRGGMLIHRATAGAAAQTMRNGVAGTKDPCRPTARTMAAATAIRTPPAMRHYIRELEIDRILCLCRRHPLEQILPRDEQAHESA